jgi:hypothetical protein
MNGPMFLAYVRQCLVPTLKLIEAPSLPARSRRIKPRLPALPVLARRAHVGAILLGRVQAFF